MIVRDESVDTPSSSGRARTTWSTGRQHHHAAPGTKIPRPGEIVVSYVVPEIHNVSPVFTKNIFSSARPLAPKIEYVVPVFVGGRRD